MAFKVKSKNSVTRANYGYKSVETLPVYKIRGKFYFRDKRLGEYREVNNPSNVLDENKVSLSSFQNPNNPKDNAKLRRMGL